jgi:hypothetical protein
MKEIQKEEGMEDKDQENALKPMKFDPSVLRKNKLDRTLTLTDLIQMMSWTTR